MTREDFMREALKEARHAARLGETPIGAVIVRNGEVIARGYNRRETGKNALFHAECMAIYRACRRLGGWRLPGCELYVTLEPCPMCAGAILNARIERVYFGAYDKKSGCAASALNLFDKNLCNYSLEAEGGILEEECSAVLKDFFRSLRSKGGRL